MREGPVQGNPEIGRCRVVGQAISISNDVEFMLGFSVIQVESCRHGFRFDEF